jgi:hypothetical protein
MPVRPEWLAFAYMYPGIFSVPVPVPVPLPACAGAGARGNVNRSNTYWILPYMPYIAGARGMQLGDDDHLKGHNPAESVRGKGGENAASPSPKDPGSVDKGDDLPAPASRVLTSEGGGVAARRESESGLRGSEVVNVLGEHMEGVAARVPSLREDKTDLAGGGGVVGGEGRNGRGGVAGLLGGAVGGEGRSGRGGAEHNEGSLSTTSLPRR